MGWESFDVVRFYLAPLLQGPMTILKLKGAFYWSYRFGMVIVHLTEHLKSCENTLYRMLCTIK